MLILDGGLGTALEDAGCNLTGDKLWATGLLIRNPEMLVHAHSAFYSAGANIVTSSSYQFDFENFEELGINKEQATRYLRKSTELVRIAAGESSHGRYVAASLGTFGSVLADGSEYTGNFGKSKDELSMFHFERLSLLLEDMDNLPDFVAFETIPCVLEVKAICDALVRFNFNNKFPDIRVWVSLTCKDAKHLNGGDLIREALDELEKCLHVSLGGFNCLSPLHLDEILSTMSFSKKLVVYPNRGEVFENRAWVPESATPDDQLLSLARKWISNENIFAIGGCCRIGTTFIRSLANISH